MFFNKIKCYLLSTFFFVGFVNCQINLQNKSLLDSNEKILYPEVENHIEFEFDIDFNNYEVLSKKGVVLKNINKKSFVVIVKGPFNALEDTLFVKDKNSDSLISYEVFKIKPLGLIKAQLGSITDSIVNYSLICENNYLKLVHEGSNYKPNTKIESFQLELFDSDGKLNKSFEITEGHQLSKKQTKSIKKMKSGSYILFKNIIIKSNTSYPRILSDLRYWII